MTLDLRVVDEAGHQFAETVAVKVSFSRPVEIQSTNLLNVTWEDDSLNGTIVKQVSESSFTFTLATPGDVEVVVTSTALPNVSGAEPFRVSFFEPPEQVILEPFTWATSSALVTESGFARARTRRVRRASTESPA